MLYAVVAVCCLLTGVCAGVVVTIRATPRLIARLDPTERVAFARKVHTHTR